MCMPWCWLLAMCRLCPRDCTDAKEDEEGKKGINDQ